MSRVFMTESWWNPNARNSIGAAGLGQIMPFNLEKFAVLYNEGNPIDPYDPATAIRVSTLYMADLLATVGDWKRSIASYNAGPYMPPARWKPETIRYVRMVWGE
jgi:soluble lytic murein transglycosylase-like protein